MVVESLDAEGKATKLGSGVVIAPGQVITNRHVIEDGVSFRVEHGDKKWTAKLIKVDPDHDLAELSVTGLNAPAVTILDSSKLAVGETVYAIGSPEGLELTISEGLISGLREFDTGRVIQTSAAISPGSSGGGLFDSQGRLVGITTFYLKEGQSLNFALPAEWTLAVKLKPPSVPPPRQGTSTSFQALVWFEAGWRAHQAGNYGAAVRAFQEVIRLLPTDDITWGLLATDYRNLKQYDKAASAEKEEIRLNPDCEPAWFLLGTDYEELGEYDKAIGALEEALRLKPDDEIAWRELGFVYQRAGQNDKAVNTLQKATQLKPDDAIAWGTLGGIYLLLGQNNSAIAALKEATRLELDNGMEWYGLGLAYKAVGRQSEVIMVYKRLKTLDPKLAEKFFQEAVLP